LKQGIFFPIFYIFFYKIKLIYVKFLASAFSGRVHHNFIPGPRRSMRSHSQRRYIAKPNTSRSFSVAGHRNTMASSSAGGGAAAVGTFSRLVDRTRVPDSALQRHAVAAFFRHLLSLPAPLPAAAHDAASALLSLPHPAVASHAAASLARLAASRPVLLPPDLAFPLLIAPLAASPSSRLASCLVKAVAALASCVLRSGSSFPPHDHPFVQALASGADGARSELMRQAARMVAEGADGVVGFLRPLVMLAAVRKGDAAFARDLISTLAAAAAAAAKPSVMIPVLKLLEESLLHFGRGDGEVRFVVSCSHEC
jgi:hypothetical protein